MDTYELDAQKAVRNIASLRVLITDFGFAIKKQDLLSESRYSCLGTPTHYPYEMLVPEEFYTQPKAGGESPRLVKRIKYDERVDIWCLGIILYSILY